jgi:hypothetical protein
MDVADVCRELAVAEQTYRLPVAKSVRRLESRRRQETGSSESSMGGRSSIAPLSVGGEQYSEPVVVELSESVGKPKDLLDD